MADDILVIKYDGYEAGRLAPDIVEKTIDKKTNEEKEKVVGWEGKLIPKSIIECVFFANERAEIEAAQSVADEAQTIFDAFLEEHSDEDDFLVSECSFDEEGKEGIDPKKVTALFKKMKKDKTIGEDFDLLNEYTTLADNIKKANKKVKELEAILEESVRAKYVELTDEEIKDLVINKKWFSAIESGVTALYVSASYILASRVTELGERYEFTLAELTASTEGYESKVKTHLERMGFVW